MSTRASDFKTFLDDKVNLNQDRLNTLNARVQAITNFLSADEVLSGSFKDVIPQGSYAHGTIIKPVGNREYDADVLLHLLEVPGWEPKAYVQQVYEAFGRSSTYKSMRGRHTRCVRIDYAGDFHVDVVPYVTLWSGGYITNRTDNVWERSEPDSFTEWLEGKDRITKGNLVKVVRLLKYLRDHKGRFAVPSVVLTSMLAHRVSETDLLFAPEAYTGVATTLKTVSSALAAHLDPWPWSPPHIDDPGTGQNLGDRWSDENYRTFRTRFAGYAQQIAAAHDTPRYSEALPKWQALFGPDFGTAVAKSAALAASAQIRPATERFLRDYGFAEVPDRRFRCTVTGYLLSPDGFSRSSMPRRGDIVPRHRSLEFKVDTNVPQPHQVYWKIRNGGDEAWRANALRGDMHLDDGSRRRTETTLYRGKHYVEAYVIRGGVCVARSRQAVIVGD